MHPSSISLDYDSSEPSYPFDGKAEDVLGFEWRVRFGSAGGRIYDPIAGTFISF
ncbi:MAG: hypothetical protein ACI97B_005063 [Verrucomicrobiales bacterium]|jgi:hypothetical protein